MEISGPAAMFTRPDTGGTPTSYPVPTWSAAKGLFESIAFFKDGAAWICPTKVEVCRHIGDLGGRVNFQRYTTNYGGPLRKGDLFAKGSISGGSSMQLFATILSNVCYRLHGIVTGPRWEGHVNPRHYLKDLFDRRLKRGECFRTPCLGWSEFTCSYWGSFREGITEVDIALSLEIPSMLLSIWNKPITLKQLKEQKSYAPRFTQGSRDDTGSILKPLGIENGVLEYDIPDEWLSKQDWEVIQDAQ